MLTLFDFTEHEEQDKIFLNEEIGAIRKELEDRDIPVRLSILDEEILSAVGTSQEDFIETFGNPYKIWFYKIINTEIYYIDIQFQEPMDEGYLEIMAELISRVIIDPCLHHRGDYSWIVPNDTQIIFNIHQ